MGLLRNVYMATLFRTLGIKKLEFRVRVGFLQKIDIFQLESQVVAKKLHKIFLITLLQVKYDC